MVVPRSRKNPCQSFRCSGGVPLMRSTVVPVVSVVARRSHVKTFEKSSVSFERLNPKRKVQLRRQPQDFELLLKTECSVFSFRVEKINRYEMDVKTFDKFCRSPTRRSLFCLQIV